MHQRNPKYWDHFTGHGDLSNELEPRLFKFLNNCVQFDEKINMVINLFSNLKILKYNSVNGLNLLTCARMQHVRPGLVPGLTLETRCGTQYSCAWSLNGF